jgi:hypothetical protein
VSRLVLCSVPLKELRRYLWDNHNAIEANHRQLAEEIDQFIAALIQDLKQRGMFDDTLIFWGGEFGRSPMVEHSDDGQSTLGRDHNHCGLAFGWQEVGSRVGLFTEQLMNSVPCRGEADRCSRYASDHASFAGDRP